MTDSRFHAGSDRIVRSETVRVWDLYVRLFHWSLVILYVIAYVSGDRWDTLHEWAGYAIAAIVTARLIWGFIGSEHARFSDFLQGPVTVVNFLADSLRLRARRYLGHNPAGGAMVIAMMASIAVISVSGVMMDMDRFWGEQWVEDVHVVAVYVTHALVALHVFGVLLASVEHRENLVRAMLTGYKRRV